MSSSVVSVIEVGTSRTVVLVGRSRAGAPPEVLGVGVQPTTGMRKGRVDTAEYVRTAVSTAMGKANEMARTDVRDVSLICSCGDVSSESLRSEAKVQEGSDVVTDATVAAARDGLERAAVVPDGREPFEVLRLGYSVDDDPSEVREPIGMAARTLCVSGLLIHGARTPIERLEDTVYDAGLGVNYLIFSGLAAGLGALTRQQREDGALCINFGGGTTSWCAYRHRHPVAAGALPIGGDHVTNDLLSAFSPGSQMAADRFKIASCQAVLRGIGRDDRVELHPDRGDPRRTVSRYAAAQVVNARMDELLRLVRDALKRSGVLGHLGAGVVICGGGARLAGLPELVSSVFNVPCSSPALSTGVPELDKDPLGFATVWGGLQQAVRKDEAEQARAASRRLVSRLKRLFN